VIDYGSVNYRVQQFDRQHGSDCINIEGWLVYSDGAKRERSPLGALIDPPEDAYERSKLQVRYREELLRRAVEEFQGLRQTLLQGAKTNLRHQYAEPPPCADEEAVAQLKELQKVVRRRQRALYAARKQLEESKPDWVRRRESASVTNKQSNERFIAAVDRIKI
jgi:hypothetical protein